MEKFISKIEGNFNSAMDEFENKPIRTTLKWVIILFIAKKIWSWMKEGD